MKQEVLSGMFALAMVVPSVDGLQVLEATSGVGESWADVTAAFKKLKLNDNLYWGYIDGNDMAGRDPAPGVAKTLVVRYRDNDGSEHLAQLRERANGGITSGVREREEFRLARAWFGLESTYVDVTEGVAKVIASGRETSLDKAALELGSRPDPAYGKEKDVLIFYSIDGEQKVWAGREREAFRPWEITGTYHPIPLATEVSSPFEGMALDTAVWQWSAPITSCISPENGEPPVAFLYVPPKATEVRGVVIGKFNMLERPILEHSAFRDVVQELGYACIWLAPAPFGGTFDFNDPGQCAVMQDVFDTLAEVSGYRELSTAPFIGIGHSAMADFPYQLAIWKPERAIACISYDGSTPGVDWHHNFGGNKLLNEVAIRKLIGIPILIRDGEYSGGRVNRRPTVLLQHVPELSVSMVSDPGSGHFDINDRIVQYLAYFIAKADRARNSADGKLKPVPALSGWYVDYWQYNKPPRVKPAPAGMFKGVEGRRGGRTRRQAIPSGMEPIPRISPSIPSAARSSGSTTRRWPSVSIDSASPRSAARGRSTCLPFIPATRPIAVPSCNRFCWFLHSAGKAFPNASHSPPSGIRRSAPSR